MGAAKGHGNARRTMTFIDHVRRHGAARLDAYPLAALAPAIALERGNKSHTHTEVPFFHMLRKRTAHSATCCGKAVYVILITFIDHRAIR